MASKKSTNRTDKGERAQGAAPVDDLLGEFAGITMPEKSSAEGGGKKGAAPSDEVVLAIEEDRTRLALQGVAYLLLAFLGLFLVAGGIGAAQISQNIVYLILVIVGLPVAWFASKAMGRRLGKLVSHTNVMDFGKRGVIIYEGPDQKKAISVSYRDIKNYKIVRHGKALRLLLAGTWVKHPSGLYFVDINRPFMESTLPGVEEEVRSIMREHRVNERK